METKKSKKSAKPAAADTVKTVEATPQVETSVPFVHPGAKPKMTEWTAEDQARADAKRAAEAAPKEGKVNAFIRAALAEGKMTDEQLTNKVLELLQVSKPGREEAWYRKRVVSKIGFVKSGLGIVSGGKPAGTPAAPKAANPAASGALTAVERERVKTATVRLKADPTLSAGDVGLSRHDYRLVVLVLEVLAEGDQPEATMALTGSAPEEVKATDAPEVNGE